MGINISLKISDIYKEVKKELELSDIENAGGEADIICEFSCGIDRTARYIHPETSISEVEKEKIFEAVKKRKENYPLQYIIGKWDFCGRDFLVGEGVLIPRDDTEILVNTALEQAEKVKTDNIRILDGFSGSGIVAITIALELGKENAEIFAIEKEDKAFYWLEKNTEKFNCGVKSLQGDCLSEDLQGQFENLDIITGNPPYLTEDEMINCQEELKSEPSTALFGGKDGLFFYEKFIPLWKISLKSGGMMALETGFEQTEAVAEIFRKNGYGNIKIIRDLADLPRVVSAIKI